MRRIVSLALVVLLPSVAFARPSDVSQKAARLVKYFNNAHGAVVNGGVAPYGKVTDIGLQARLLVGARGGVSKVSVVHKGMETRSLALYGGTEFGVQLGAGPEVRTRSYFGPRGMSSAELTPTRETSVHDSVILGGGVSKTSTGAAGAGWNDVGLHIGSVQGTTARTTIKTSAPRPTPMLQHLSEGLALSKEVQTALQSGRMTPDIAHKVDRLEHLHTLIKTEKAQLNKTRADVRRQVAAQLP
jgi:hypothetical protein